MEDPDPYGVKALQAEGLEIREAGTNSRPSAEVFEFKPATTSPIFPSYRKSVELRERANGWRGSMHSVASVDKGTQTEDDDYRSVTHSPVKRSSQPPSPIRKETEHLHDSSDEDDQVHDSDASIQEPSQTRTAVPIVAQARMVVVPKRVPPSLPPRNPNRTSSSPKKDEEHLDGFDNVSLTGSTQSDPALEKRKSDATVKNDVVGTAPLSTEEHRHHHPAVNVASGGAGEEEFHSVRLLLRRSIVRPSPEHSNLVFSLMVHHFGYYIHTSYNYVLECPQSLLEQNAYRSVGPKVAGLEIMAKDREDGPKSIVPVLKGLPTV